MPKPPRRSPPPPQQQNRLWNIRNAANNVPVIELFGDIGTSKDGDPWWGIEGGAGTFQEFAAELKAIGPVPELRLEIHSYGGDVVVGKGIYDKLIEHPANKTAVIFGMCASAATYPALACEKIIMSANSFMVIHNSWGCCCGNSKDMRRYADTLDVIDGAIASLYAERTGKPLDEIKALMEKDTWLTGADAIALGLADETIEAVEITPEKQTNAANFAARILNTMPEGALAWFDSQSLQTPTNAIHMLRPNSPIFNAADPGVLSCASPAPAPAAAPAPAPAPAAAAPANAVPVAAPAAAPAPAPAAAPANAAPAISLDDITKAVQNAVQPLQTRLETLEAQNKAGITPQNLGGAQPALVAGGDGGKAAAPAAPVNAATQAMAAWSIFSK